MIIVNKTITYMNGIYSIYQIYVQVHIAITKTDFKMTDVRLRQLFIKTGVVKRLTKEKIVYEKEAEQQRNRITKLTKEGQDEYVLRKQEEVLQECLMMVPDCQRRF